MKKRNVAVLLIHMQEYFTSGENQGTRKVIPAQIEVLKRFNKLEIPIFLIEWNLETPILLGPTDSEILDALSGKPFVHRIISPIVDAYNGTDSCEGLGLREWLSRYEVKSVVIMGTKTCACVHFNAEETKKLGKEVIVSFDLMAAECGDCFQNFQEERKCDWFFRNAVCFFDHKQLVEYVEIKFP